MCVACCELEREQTHLLFGWVILLFKLCVLGFLLVKRPDYIVKQSGLERPDHGTK